MTEIPTIPSGTREGDLIIFVAPKIVSHCQRPGCGLPLGDLVMIDAQGRAVCHRHALCLVTAPLPTLQERLAAYKRSKLVR